MSTIDKMKSWIFSDTTSQLLMGMLGAIIIAVIINFVPPFEKPRIATVDITGITHSFVAKLAKDNLPANLLSERVSLYGEALDKSIKKISRQNSLILMPREAVIAGAKDVTALVQQDVAQFLDHEKNEKYNKSSWNQ